MEKIYLGYANTNDGLSFSDSSVGDNVIMCGSNAIYPEFTFQANGQYNFVYVVDCTNTITWALNGSVLVFNQADFSTRTCSSIGVQKITLSLTTSPMNITTQQQQTLASNLVESAGVEAGIINVSVSTSTNTYQNHEIVVSVYDNSTTSSAAVIYNLTKLYTSDPTTIPNLLTKSNINYSSVSVQTLTFNETVGTQRGCIKNVSNSLIALYGDNNCPTPIIPQTNGAVESPSSIENANVMIVLIIVSVVSLVGVILTLTVMFVKPLRQCVFPHEQETKEKLKWRKQSEKMIRNEGSVSHINQDNLE